MGKYYKLLKPVLCELKGNRIMEKDKKEKLKLAITLAIIVIAFGVAITIMLKYSQEGENNMPFNLSEIIVVSSAEGVSKTENSENYKWNLDIMQYNDIYLNISKNENYNKNAYIESVSLENFSFTTPKVGNIRIYMPNSADGGLFAFKDEYLINRVLTYNGAENSNTKTLEISSQGGNALFRVANTKVGEYVSNDDAEIAHNGTLINKTGVSMDDLKHSISFDIVIHTNIAKYRGKVNLDLPVGDILAEGTSQLDQRDCSSIVFKRETI